MVIPSYRLLDEVYFHKPTKGFAIVMGRKLDRRYVDIQHSSKGHVVVQWSDLMETPYTVHNVPSYFTFKRECPEFFLLDT